MNPNEIHVIRTAIGLNQEHSIAIRTFNNKVHWVLITVSTGTICNDGNMDLTQWQLGMHELIFNQALRSPILAELLS